MKKKSLDRIKFKSIVFGRNHTLKLNFNRELTEKQLAVFKIILKKVDLLILKTQMDSLGLIKDEIMDLSLITLEEIRFNKDEFKKTNCPFIRITENGYFTVKVLESFYEIMDRHFDLKEY